jgi:hypothetical protein
MPTLREKYISFKLAGLKVIRKETFKKPCLV